MKLYKYRSLNNLEYTLDILLNERLHCAPYEKLNDPCEGLFLSVTRLGAGFGVSPFASFPFAGTRTIKKPQSVSELHIPEHTRVCSLSASLNDVRLWSHYADGHTGIAIEIDFDALDKQLHQVEYVDQLREFGNTALATPEPTEVLRLKTIHWSYEQEYRLIDKVDYFPITGRITGVYMGLRTSPLLQELLLRTLPEAIPVYTTKLNETSITVEPGNILTWPTL